MNRSSRSSSRVNSQHGHYHTLLPTLWPSNVAGIAKRDRNTETLKVSTSRYAECLDEYESTRRASGTCWSRVASHSSLAFQYAHTGTWTYVIVSCYHNCAVQLYNIHSDYKHNVYTTCTKGRFVTLVITSVTKRPAAESAAELLLGHFSVAAPPRPEAPSGHALPEVDSMAQSELELLLRSDC